MLLDALGPWRPALLALAVALVWSALFRWLRRPELAALGAGCGIAAGWLLALGSLSASPRQLPERLPLLLLAASGAALVLTPLLGARRWGVGLAAAALLAAGAWWLVGAPMAPGDLRRAVLPLSALALLFGLVALRLEGPWPALAALAGLALALLLSGGPPGPWLLLCVTALASAAGTLPAGPAWAGLARVPAAAALAALIAAPVLVRGTTPDWLVAATPLAVLWLGPALAPYLGGRAAAQPLGWALAGAGPLLFLWLLTRGI